MIAGEQRDRGIVAAADPLERMRAARAHASRRRDTVASCLNAVTRACRNTSTASLSASTNRSPTFAQLSVGRVDDFVEAVVDLLRVADRAVAGDRPRRGRPDDDRGARQIRRDRALATGNFTQTWSRDVVLVFDLGFGERGLLHHRPHHRLRAAIERAVVRELHQLARDLRLGGEVHGGVGMGPVALDAEPLELLALHVDPVLARRRGTRGGIRPWRRHRHVLVLALGAVLLLDLPFDREAVAVPARHVVGVEAQHLLAARHHVLEDLVERVADMDVAVGVGRAVVQHEFRPARARPRAAARRGRCSSQRLRISGSFCGSPARIGKSVLGRNRVSL